MNLTFSYVVYLNGHVYCSGRFLAVDNVRADTTDRFGIRLSNGSSQHDVLEGRLIDARTTLNGYYEPQVYSLCARDYLACELT